jgi:hypothetical protein
LLWNRAQALPKVKGFTKVFLRLSDLEKDSRRKFDRSHAEFKELQSSPYSNPTEVKRALIRMQKDTLNIAEAQGNNQFFFLGIEEKWG